MTKTVSGLTTIPEIIRNDEQLYEGNLRTYLSIIFNKAQNLAHPYHNFRHMLHVTWLLYQACLYYVNNRTTDGHMTKRSMRYLLIAGLFHDYNHSGLMGDDDLNVERAVRSFVREVLPEDKQFAPEIIRIIKATEYPYTISSANLEMLEQRIIRDADMAQSLGTAWIQQVIFGLSSEWGKRPIDVLKMQIGFHKSLHFHTEWGRNTFTQEMIDAKLREAEELLEIVSIPES